MLPQEELLLLPHRLPLLHLPPGAALLAGLAAGGGKPDVGDLYRQGEASLQPAGLAPTSRPGGTAASGAAGRVDQLLVEGPLQELLVGLTDEDPVVGAAVRPLPADGAQPRSSFWQTDLRLAGLPPPGGQLRVGRGEPQHCRRVLLELGRVLTVFMELECALSVLLELWRFFIAMLKLERLSTVRLELGRIFIVPLELGRICTIPLDHGSLVTVHPTPGTVGGTLRISIEKH